MAVMQDLTIEAHVSTSDGKLLGTVKEIAGDRFKVDAPRRPDYWLPAWTVKTAYPGAVELAYPSEAVGDLKVHKPAADASDGVQAIRDPDRLV